MSTVSSAPPETVAVVTTVLNERDSIEALLMGFLTQTRAPDEIVVVDGGSTDGTIELIQRIAQTQPSVRLYVERGVNIARGHNIAIARSRCSLMAVTDGGCQPEPDWLARLVEPLVANTAYSAVTGERRIVSANRFEAFAGVLSTSENAPSEDDRTFHGRNSAFRKSLWQQVGGYPEWLYTAEDTLFATRARQLGCRVALADRAVVSWRPRPSLRKLGKQYFLYGQGTGRIGHTNPAVVRYHLRNHAMWMLPLLLAPLSPWLLLVSAAVLAYLFHALVRPALRIAQRRTATPGAAFYVPVIVMTRSLCNNLGQFVGHREYTRDPKFKVYLDDYMSGRTAQRAAAGGPA